MGKRVNTVSTNAKAAKIKAYVSARETLVEKEKRFAQEISQLESKLKQSEINLKKKNKELSKFKDELKTIKEEGVTNSEASNDRIAFLEKALSEKDEKIKSIQDSFEQEKIQLKNAKHSAEEKKRNAVRALKKEKQLKADCELLAEEEKIKNEKLKLRVSKTQKERQQYEEAIKNAEILGAEANKKIESLIKENEKLKREKESQEKHIKDIGIKSNEREQKQEEERTRLQDEIQALEAKISNISEQEENIETMIKKKNELESNLEEEKYAAAKMKTELDHQNQACQKKDEIIEDLNDRLAKISRSSKPEFSAEKLNAQYDDLSSRHEIMKTRLEKIEKALHLRNISVEFLLGSNETTSREKEKQRKEPEIRSSTSSVSSKCQKPKALTSALEKPRSRDDIKERTAKQDSSEKRPRREKSDKRLKRGKSETKLRDKDEDRNKEVKPKTKASKSEEEKCIFPTVKGAIDTGTLKQNNNDMIASGRSSQQNAKDTLKADSETSHAKNPLTKAANDERYEEHKKKFSLSKHLPVPKIGQAQTKLGNFAKKRKVRNNKVMPTAKIVPAAKVVPTKESKAASLSTEKSRSSTETTKSSVNTGRNNRNDKTAPRRSKSLPRDTNPSSNSSTLYRSVARNGKLTKDSAKTGRALTKLDLGARITDLAPETSPQSDHCYEGDFDSLLYPRPQNGWRTRDEEGEASCSPREHFEEKVLENARRARMESNYKDIQGHAENLQKKMRQTMSKIR